MANKFSSEARESLFGRIVESAIDGTSTIDNFIEFTESDSGPRIVLYPMQRVIAKAVTGVPMDFREKMVPIWDKHREKIVGVFRETEVFKWLADNGKCNVSDWRDLNPRGYNDSAIFVGRRGGKSELISVLSLYQLYCLLCIRSPHEYYGLPEGSPIDFTYMAQDDKGAGRLYDKAKQGINRTGFFGPFLRKTPGSKDMKFVTQSDRGKRDVIPSITIASYPCTTNAVRGPSSIFLALDEFAHFRSATGSNSDEVYEAAKPATMQFVNPAGYLDSRVISISSPWKKTGKAYELHKIAMEEGNKSSIITFNLATAEMNPRADADFLRKAEKTSPLSWKCEYGGEFLDSSGSYVVADTIDLCVDTGRDNTSSFDKELIGQKMFWGIDVGLKNDATTVAVSRWIVGPHEVPILRFEYVDRMMVGEPPYENVTELPLDDIVRWFSDLNNLMPGFKGAVDQHGGSIFKQLLHRDGLTFVDYVHLTESINSEMYSVLRGLLEQRRVRFPNNQTAMKELKNLELEYINKHRIRVQAPSEKDSHDDLADAIAISAWQATKWLLENADQFAKFGVDLSALIRQDASLFGAGATTIDVHNMSLSEINVAHRQNSMMNNPFNGGEGYLSPRQLNRTRSGGGRR